MSNLDTSMTLPQWVSFLESASLPVLQNSLADLAMLRQDEEQLSALNVAQVILRDPMLTAHLLRYLQQHRSRHQQAEIVEVEQAVMMLGMNNFFDHVLPGLVAVEEALAGFPDALKNLVRVLGRAEKAAEYGRDWAIRLNDRRYAEVYVAALLHDLAEMLMWCFAPQVMLTIRAAQEQDKTLRSQLIQEQVLGFTLVALQRELAINWGLPELLLTLMGEAAGHLPRVRNVALAVNLARHSANGWDDAALPDDYTDIAQLLRMTPQEVRHLVIPGRMVK
ncbi:MAG: HDOD domain-containing protein [Ferrovum sp.]|nr:HDOD domain-containing protein [Ferrovum sp.]NDU88099.1 HDOD domain-containing protein [Ferrovum sp.]